jgi:hypothetical protein
MTTTTEFIAQAVAGAGKYIQCAFANNAESVEPTHVGIISTHAVPSSAASEMHLRVSDDGSTWANIWGDWATTGYVLSLTGAHWLHKVLANTPSGTGWYRAALDEMRFQWGNSDDVAPVPYLHSICMEVEWP